jgi:D-3-phosphoglycerate dehydrogenase
MRFRCAVLDDYQNVAMKLADWGPIAGDVDVKVFDKHMNSPDEVHRALADFQIVCMMRERTPFRRNTIEALPNLKLLITTGARNASIDMAAAAERGITVCSTSSFGNPTTGITFGLILELTRRIGSEHARLKAGQAWQVTLGPDIEGMTLGIIGLGKLGTRVAGVARAFGMKVIAWSPNLTPEKCKEAGVEYAAKEDLFRQADIVTIHLPLGDRSRGVVGAKEICLMKPTALLINTARGPIVDEKALIAALTESRIAGAGLDVFDIEPLPLDHPFRRMDNVVITPHLGYVSRQNYAQYFSGIVEDIRGFLDGKPVRPAVFLDRDGTLNEDTGYMHRVADFRWLSGAIRAVRRLNEASFYVFVVTNQSGVARGLFDEAAVRDLHRWMNDDLRRDGAHIDDIRYCPHHPEGRIPAYAIGCPCRKPAPGMILDLMRSWPVDPAASMAIGDQERDAAAARAAGIPAEIVPPGALEAAVERLLRRELRNVSAR